jgi:hypothetical protein
VHELERLRDELRASIERDADAAGYDVEEVEDDAAALA